MNKAQVEVVTYNEYIDLFYHICSRIASRDAIISYAAIIVDK